MTGLDTNVLARFLTRDDPKQFAAAARLIAEAERRGLKLIVSPVVLCELVWVLETAYDLPRATVATTLEKIFHTVEFETLEKDLLWPALDDYRAGPGDFSDYYIGRRNRQAGAEFTWTFDKHLKTSSHFRLATA